MSWALFSSIQDKVYTDRSLEEIREWGMAGLIGPGDQISVDDGPWVPAHEITELEMNWVVPMKTGDLYGPCNVPTIRDFVAENLIDAECYAEHLTSKARIQIKSLLQGHDGPQTELLKPTILQPVQPAMEPNLPVPQTKVQKVTKPKTERLIINEEPAIPTEPTPYPNSTPPPLPPGAVRPES